MKAILVIDIPECCAECPLMLWDAESEYYGACCPTLKEDNCVADSYKENENKGTKPNWCPLRPLPSKKDVTVKRIEDIPSCSITGVADNISARIILKTDEIFAIGWNACLDSIIGNDCISEITGETE